MTTQTTDSCSCLSCDPTSGEIGRECCKRPTYCPICEHAHPEDVRYKVAERATKYGFLEAVARRKSEERKLENNELLGWNK